MKGLILYEFLSMRKTIVSSIFIILPILFAFFVIVTLGIEHGNLRDLALANLSDVFVMMFNIFVSFYAGLCGYIIISGKFTADVKNWNKYSFSLPVSDMARIGAKYAITTMITVTAFLMILGMSAILSSIVNHPVAQTLQVVVAVFCFAAAAAYVNISLLHIVKSKLIVSVIILALSVLFVIVNTSTQSISTIYEDGTVTRTYPSMLDYLGHLVLETIWFMPLVLCATAALSFFASLMTAKRREKLC